MNSKRVLNTKIAKCRKDSKSVTVFGAMLLNGNDVAMISEGSKAGDFVRFIDAVRKENPRTPIVLILDNARIHHAIITREKCGEADIKLVFLPPYSPDLNPIEFAWKDGKKELRMKDLDTIKQKTESTVMNLMKNRKMGYSKVWREKFPRWVKGD